MPLGTSVSFALRQFVTVECVEHRIVSDHRQDDLIERLTKIARSFLGDGSMLCFILARFILGR